VDACRPTSQPILPKAYGDKEHRISQVILVPAADANCNADESDSTTQSRMIWSHYTLTLGGEEPRVANKDELSKAASTGKLMDRKLSLLWPAVACEVSTQ